MRMHSSTAIGLAEDTFCQIHVADNLVSIYGLEIQLGPLLPTEINLEGIGGIDK